MHNIFIFYYFYFNKEITFSMPSKLQKFDEIMEQSNVLKQHISSFFPQVWSASKQVYGKGLRICLLLKIKHELRAKLALELKVQLTVVYLFLAQWKWLMSSHSTLPAYYLQLKVFCTSCLYITHSK